MTADTSGSSTASEMTEGSGMGGTTVDETAASEAEADGTSTAASTTAGETANVDTTAGETTSADTTAGEPGMCTFPPPDGIQCQAPGTAEFEFAVFLDGLPWEEASVDEMCTLSASSDDGVVSTLAFDCPSGAVQVEISSTPHQDILIVPGSVMTLSYRHQQEDEVNFARHLSLRYQGGSLALAAFDASELPSASQLDVSPLLLELPPSNCTPTSNEFDIDIQQTALRVTFGDVSVDVYGNDDGYVGELESYRVFTGVVERIQCFPEDAGYNYAEWGVRAAVFLIPEG